jgi:hypothetical protein
MNREKASGLLHARTRKLLLIKNFIAAVQRLRVYSCDQGTYGWDQQVYAKLSTLLLQLDLQRV